MLTAMTACQSGDQLPSTPTKTPAPLVAADSEQVQQSGGQPTPALFFTPVPEEVIIDVGPETLPSNTNPLTGLPVDDVSTIERRPVAVAVSNSPPEFTRPQAGLGAADIVYEVFHRGRRDPLHGYLPLAGP